jgi:hypothetical protein
VSRISIPNRHKETSLPGFESTANKLSTEFHRAPAVVFAHKINAYMSATGRFLSHEKVYPEREQGLLGTNPVKIRFIISSAVDIFY